MGRPAPTHWHDQIADRTREVYAAATTGERIDEIRDAAEHRARELRDVREGDHDAVRERRAWLGVARICITQRARRAIATDFVRGYIAAALWSTTDNSREDGGDPLEDNFGPEDLSDEARAKVAADCERFCTDNAALLAEASDRYDTEAGGWEQCGHDFWLTRNGHGCGFWDRGELEAGGLGAKLTEACKPFGEVWITVDGGQLHGF